VIEQFRGLAHRFRGFDLEPEVTGLSQVLARFDFESGLVWLGQIEKSLEKQERGRHRLTDAAEIDDWKKTTMKQPCSDV